MPRMWQLVEHMLDLERDGRNVTCCQLYYYKWWLLICYLSSLSCTLLVCRLFCWCSGLICCTIDHALYRLVHRYCYIGVLSFPVSRVCSSYSHLTTVVHSSGWICCLFIIIWTAWSGVFLTLLFWCVNCLSYLFTSVISSCANCLCSSMHVQFDFMM